VQKNAFGSLDPPGPARELYGSSNLVTVIKEGRVKGRKGLGIVRRGRKRGKRSREGEGKEGIDRNREEG